MKKDLHIDVESFITAIKDSLFVSPRDIRANYVEFLNGKARILGKAKLKNYDYLNDYS